MRRFHIPADAIHDKLVVFPPKEARHVRTVLRMRVGNAIELIDGTGNLYQVILTRVDRHGVEAVVEACHASPSAGGCPLTLGQSLLKGQKMDLIVQKATELGVESFQPLMTKFSDGRCLSERLDRWHRISIEACKQSHRTRPMQIRQPVALRDLDTGGFTHRFLCWERAGPIPPPEVLGRTPGPICLLIGPEGGFHDDEVANLKEHGFMVMGLGPLILRAETAALAAIALVQYCSGNWFPRAAPSS